MYAKEITFKKFCRQCSGHNARRTSWHITNLEGLYQRAKCVDRNKETKRNICSSVRFVKIKKRKICFSFHFVSLKFPCVGQLHSKRLMLVTDRENLNSLWRWNLKNTFAKIRSKQIWQQHKRTIIFIIYL